MESSSIQSSSQQALWKDAEVGKEKTAKHRCLQRAAITLSLVFLLLTVSILGAWHFWSPPAGKVYDHEYTALVDGMKTDSLMEIDPVHRIEVFRMGNSADEILEVHDFKNGITGIRFSKHKRCYIKSQTKELPTLATMEMEESNIELGEVDETVEVRVEDSQVWVPSDEPIRDHTFLLESKIWEVCQELPIHWIHPLPLPAAEFHDVEDVEDTPAEDTRGQRKARDIPEDVPVNDYRDIGLELTNALDEQGYCCQYCRRGYRHCQRYHEPLRGFWPYPYYYQGGRVICQIIMPCNWWIARMLGRV